MRPLVEAKACQCQELEVWECPDDADTKKMPYEDSMFDLIMCNGMFHHVAEPIHVLSEAARVASEGGALFFQDSVYLESLEQVSSWWQPMPEPPTITNNSCFANRFMRHSTCTRRGTAVLQNLSLAHPHASVSKTGFWCGFRRRRNSQIRGLPHRDGQGCPSYSAAQHARSYQPCWS
jgi:SAM-dependent methyltransferase